MNISVEILMKLWEISSPNMRQAAMYAILIEKYNRVIEAIQKQKTKNETTKSPG